MNTNLLLTLAVLTNGSLVDVRDSFTKDIREVNWITVTNNVIYRPEPPTPRLVQCITTNGWVTTPDYKVEGGTNYAKQRLVWTTNWCLPEVATNAVVVTNYVVVTNLVPVRVAGVCYDGPTRWVVAPGPSALPGKAKE